MSERASERAWHSSRHLETAFPRWCAPIGERRAADATGTRGAHSSSQEAASCLMPRASSKCAADERRIAARHGTASQPATRLPCWLAACAASAACHAAGLPRPARPGCAPAARRDERSECVRKQLRGNRHPQRAWASSGILRRNLLAFFSRLSSSPSSRATSTARDSGAGSVRQLLS